MPVTDKCALNCLDLPSLEFGTSVYLYRVYKDKFLRENVIINCSKSWKHNGFPACHRGICARYDEKGKLTTTKVSYNPGEIYTNGANTNVWFFEKNDKKAKSLIVADYQRRIDTAQARIDKLKHIMNSISN